MTILPFISKLQNSQEKCTTTKVYWGWGVHKPTCCQCGDCVSTGENVCISCEVLSNIRGFNINSTCDRFISKWTFILYQAKVWKHCILLPTNYIHQPSCRSDSSLFRMGRFTTLLVETCRIETCLIFLNTIKNTVSNKLRNLSKMTNFGPKIVIFCPNRVILDKSISD